MRTQSGLCWHLVLTCGGSDLTALANGGRDPMARTCVGGLGLVFVAHGGLSPAAFAFRGFALLAC